MSRTGVFVCHCGTNIAAGVDVAAVARALAGEPGVAHAAGLPFCCSKEGQASIRAAVREKGLDRVVVASCSPRMHEGTFQKCIAAAGLNPCLLEMANLREQCSWVHPDRGAATAKALALTRMAAAKARLLEPLSPRPVPVAKRALVIGGGIAGITAALSVVHAGFPATLVERSPSLGGRMAQLEKTFPTLDCSA